MSKHTPGPWSNDDGDIIGPDGGYIAYGHTGQRAIDIDEDANLIAAAPDLLEALEELVIAADTFSVSGVYFNSFKENFAALKKAMTALEKARGEQ